MMLNAQPRLKLSQRFYFPIAFFFLLVYLELQQTHCVNFNTAKADKEERERTGMQIYIYISV